MITALTTFKDIHLVAPNPHVMTTERGMVITDPDMSFEDAENITIQLREYRKSFEKGSTCLQLNDGDWMRFVEEKFEEWPQLVDQEDWDKRRNHKYVAGKIPIDRRRDGLVVRFDHYRYVAPLEIEQQEKYLDMVEEEGLTTRALKERIDEDMIALLLDTVDDEDFWRYYQDQKPLNHSQLKDKIEEGRGVAERELRALHLTLEQFLIDWDVPENRGKTDYEKCQALWNAARGLE